MNAITLLAGLAIWFLLAAALVALLVAEGRRERNSDAAVLPGGFDCPAFEPLDDIEPQFAEPTDDGTRPALGFVIDCKRDDAASGVAEPVHEDHERETYLSEAR